MHQFESMCGCSHSKITTMTTGQCTSNGSRIGSTSSNVDKRSNNDSNHVVKEAVASNVEIPDTRIGCVATKVSASDRARRIGPLIRCATKRGKVVRTQ